MPQAEHIELAWKRHGKRFDHDERARKKEARGNHLNAAISKKLRGLKALYYYVFAYLYGWCGRRYPAAARNPADGRARENLEECTHGP